jgi:replicative DNA helicase
MIENLANLELERNYLASIIKTNNFTEVSEITKEEHFTTEGNKAIFWAIKKIDEIEKDLSIVAVGEELRKTNPDHLSILKIIGAEEATSDIKITAQELIEWSNKRKCYTIAQTMLSDLSEGKTSSQVQSRADSGFLGMDSATGSKAKPYWEVEQEVEAMPPRPIYSTKIKFLDDTFKGGLTGGQLILLMGDPDAGKTIFGFQMLHNISFDFPVLSFPFEFPVRDYIENNKEKKTKLNKENVFLVDEGDDLNDVIRELKLFAKAGGKVGLIDSQMMLTNIDNTGTVEQMETEKFIKLAKIAHHYEMLIFFIVQQGKDDKKGGVYTPMHSKKGAHAAYQIWYIHTEKEKIQNGKNINALSRILEINKNKQNGRKPKIPMYLNPAFLTFHKKYKKNEEAPIDAEVSDQTPQISPQEAAGKGGAKQLTMKEIPDDGIL